MYMYYNCRLRLLTLLQHPKLSMQWWWWWWRQK